MTIEETITSACDRVPGLLHGALVLLPEGLLFGGIGAGGAFDGELLVRSAARVLGARIGARPAKGASEFVEYAFVSDALLRVEHLTTEDSGLLAFGIEQRGGIFVEKGRVCWIAASGLGRRLRDLLLLHSNIDEAERVCERCRVHGGMVAWWAKR